ncbi:MAG: diacylglycerol kinase family lipid kinase [Clostridia bacterium]|nr:diacylglycerol kinase family lipid kinase [Clostridia bacterium]
MKHYILVNPVSGNRRGLKRGITIKKLLEKYNIEATIVVSECPGYLTKVAYELSHKHTCRFYSVGGDGTLNEIITGMIGTSSDVVVIPCGTGNDFVKSISQYMSMRKIIIHSINKEATPTDILKLNKNRYCINILNCGFDAMVAKNVDMFRKIPFISGKAKYNLSIFYSLLTNRNYQFKLRVDNEIVKQSFTLIAVANGKYYGGGVCPCPEANTQDGILNVCSINSTRIRHKIKFLPKYNKGKHTDLSIVHIAKGNKVQIVSNKEFPISIDGEVHYDKKISAQIIPTAINIVHI